MEHLRKFLERRARALEASGRSLEVTRELTREKGQKRILSKLSVQFNVLSSVNKVTSDIYLSIVFVRINY